MSQIMDQTFNRTWADHTRKIKKPFRGCRILGNDGFVLEFKGKKWWKLRKPTEVAVLSTAKVYIYKYKKWMRV